MTRQQIIEESNYLAIQFADADIDVRDAIKIGFQYAAVAQQAYGYPGSGTDGIVGIERPGHPQDCL